MRLNEEDMILVGGDFLTADLQHDKAWILRYFKSDILKRFVVYFVTFRDLTNRVSLRYYSQLFIDHTGWYCSYRLICNAARKLKAIEEAVAEADKAKDLETLTNIKLGAYKIRQK